MGLGFGEAAKAALSKAVEALQAIAEVKAVVQQVQQSNFNFERRMELRIEGLETRIRELERENSKLHGQVQGAYADALKAVFFDRHRERIEHPDGIGTPRVSLADSSVSAK